MEFLYIFFAVILVWAECSSYINTHNIVKKVGIFLISIGCMIQYAGHPNMLIFLGAFMYISVDFYKKFMEHKHLINTDITETGQSDEIHQRQ